MNSHLARVSCRITDLYKDLRDGRMLIKLLEVLSGEMLVKPLSVPGPLPLGPVAGAIAALQGGYGLGVFTSSRLSKVSSCSFGKFQYLL